MSSILFKKIFCVRKNLSYMHGEVKIVVLTNRIVYIKPTTFFCCPNIFLVFPTKLFIKPTKQFVIVFCLTKLFVKRTKILLGQQKIIFLFYTFFHVTLTERGRVWIKEKSKLLRYGTWLTALYLCLSLYRH